MRTAVLALLALLVADEAHGQSPERLVFDSPGGRWRVVAHFHNRSPGHLQDGYVYELRHRRNGKIYFAGDWTDYPAGDGSDQATSVEPRGSSVIWSPDGRSAAVDCFYGRALESVSIINVSGRKPTNYGLAIEGLFGPQDFSLVRAERWLNRTDLVVGASLPGAALQDARGPTNYMVVVRCNQAGYTIVKKKAGSRYDARAVGIDRAASLAR